MLPYTISVIVPISLHARIGFQQFCYGGRRSFNREQLVPSALKQTLAKVALEFERWPEFRVAGARRRKARSVWHRIFFYAKFFFSTKASRELGVEKKLHDTAKDGSSRSYSPLWHAIQEDPCSGCITCYEFSSLPLTYPITGQVKSCNL